MYRLFELRREETWGCFEESFGEGDIALDPTTFWYRAWRNRGAGAEEKTSIVEAWVFWRGDIGLGLMVFWWLAKKGGGHGLVRCRF
jgi:hypothetical protein